MIKILGEASNIPFFIGLNDVANTGTWAWDQPIGKTLTVYSIIVLNLKKFSSTILNLPTGLQGNQI